MQVYRIEHKRIGQGPYATKSELFGWDEDKWPEWFKHFQSTTQCDPVNYPSPVSDDGIGRYPRFEEHHGFESIESLLNWFEPWLHHLESHGFHVVVYDCDEVMVGDKQVLFRKSSATIVGSLTP